MSEQRETPEQYKARVCDIPLSVQGKSTDLIWGMEDVHGLIGLRFDCGDSGTLYLTYKQAQEVIKTLQLFTDDESFSDRPKEEAKS